MYNFLTFPSINLSFYWNLNALLIDTGVVVATKKGYMLFSQQQRTIWDSVSNSTFYAGSFWLLRRELGSGPDWVWSLDRWVTRSKHYHWAIVTLGSKANHLKFIYEIHDESSVNSKAKVRDPPGARNFSTAQLSPNATQTLMIISPLSASSEDTCIPLKVQKSLSRQRCVDFTHTPPDSS